MLGVDHQQLGAGLADAWKFPRSCQLVAGFHHQPMQLTDDRVLVGLVHVADILCARTPRASTSPPVNSIDASLLANSTWIRHPRTIQNTIPTLVSDAAALFG